MELGNAANAAFFVTPPLPLCKGIYLYYILRKEE